MEQTGGTFAKKRVGVFARMAYKVPVGSKVPIGEQSSNVKYLEHSFAKRNGL